MGSLAYDTAVAALFSPRKGKNKNAHPVEVDGGTVARFWSRGDRTAWHFFILRTNYSLTKETFHEQTRTYRRDPGCTTGPWRRSFCGFAEIELKAYLDRICLIHALGAATRVNTTLGAKQCWWLPKKSHETGRGSVSGRPDPLFSLGQWSVVREERGGGGEGAPVCRGCAVNSGVNGVAPFLLVHPLFSWPPRAALTRNSKLETRN